MKEIIIAYDEITEANPVIGDWVGELVRCKDCKHYQKFGACNHIEGAKDDPDWFCADGEKRE